MASNPRKYYLDPRAELVFQELEDTLTSAHLSQAEVERRLRWGAKHISRMKSGYQRMTLSHLFDILDVAEMPHEHFFRRLTARYEMRRFPKGAKAIQLVADLQHPHIGSHPEEILRDPDKLRDYVRSIIKEFIRPRKATDSPKQPESAKQPDSPMRPESPKRPKPRKRPNPDKHEE